jgi:hypothetical protein
VYSSELVAVLASEVSPHNRMLARAACGLIVLGQAPICATRCRFDDFSGWQ